MKIENIDVFCEVIDNYGDVGVAYRLARELKKFYRAKKIRLFVDKIEEINLMKSHGTEEIEIIKFSNMDINIKVADLVIECFGCNIPADYMEKAYENSKILLNLEYFSAENWIEDFHLQESFLGRGRLRKFFFMPSISEKSGGLIIDSDFIKRKDEVIKNRKEFLKKYGIEKKYDLIGSIFSYEKSFDKLVETLEKTGKKVLLLIMSEKTQKNFIKYFDNTNKYDKIEFVKLPFYPYNEYEEILSLCDFNFVRGEDSFARALLLGKPFLWHIYPQTENTHMIKLESFLDKYCKDWKELKNTFIRYNLSDDGYEYFFENLDKISQHNEKYSRYLLENCNLVDKLNNFIENLGGSK